jgi:integrase/recombinase XerD
MKPKSTAPSAQARHPQRVIHFLTQDEFMRLLTMTNPKHDRAIFLLTYRHGLRASEIGLLQRTDVDSEQGRLTVHQLKGSLSAIYPMPPDMLKLLRSYLRTRMDDSPYLFLSNREVSIDRRHSGI